MVDQFNPTSPVTRPTQANADNRDQIHVQLHQQLPDAIGELRTGLANAITQINSELLGKVGTAGFVEAAQDATAALIKAGTNVTVNYDDAANTFTINATATGAGTGTDPEVVRDTIGGALVGGSGVQIVVNDAADTITISVAAIPAAAITTGQFAVARLGTGTPNSATALFGDGAWRAPAKADVGLGNVDNTSDASKPVSTAVADELAKRPSTTDFEEVGDATSALSGLVKLPGGTSGAVITGVHRGDWAANGTRYNVNDLVVNAGVTSRCTTAHTSGAAFSDANFTPVPAAAVPNANVQIPTVGWTAPGSDPSYNGLMLPTRPPVTYQRKARMFSFDDATKLFRNNTFGDHTGTITMNTTESPFPAGNVEITNMGYTGTRWGMNLDRVTDLTNCYMRLLIKTSPTNYVGSIQFHFATDKAAYDAGNYHRYSLGNASNWLRGYLVHEGIAPALCTKIGAGCDWTSVGYLVIHASAVDGTNTFTLGLGYLDAVVASANKAKAVIWHDDSTQNGFNRMLPMMSRYNFPGTLAAALGMTNGSGYYTSAMLRSMYLQHGWQVACHSATMEEHIALDADGVYSQAMKNRSIAGALGVRGTDDFAWWGGLQTTSANYKTVQRVFRAARYNTSNLSTPEQLPPAEPWCTKALLCSTTDEVADWIALVDKAIACKGMAQFVFHNDWGSTLYGPGYADPASAPSTSFSGKFAQLLAYLDSRRADIDVVTFDDALMSAIARSSATTFTGGTSTPGVVAAPTALSLTATPDSGSVTVTATGGQGTGVTYALYQGTTATGTPVATGFPATISGLTNGTEYSFIATATNAGGTVTSAVVKATPTAATNPNPPTSGTRYSYASTLRIPENQTVTDYTVAVPADKNRLIFAVALRGTNADMSNQVNATTVEINGIAATRLSYQYVNNASNPADGRLLMFFHRGSSSLPGTTANVRVTTAKALASDTVGVGGVVATLVTATNTNAPVAATDTTTASQNTRTLTWTPPSNSYGIFAFTAIGATAPAVSSAATLETAAVFGGAAENVNLVVGILSGSAAAVSVTATQAGGATSSMVGVAISGTRV